MNKDFNDLMAAVCDGRASDEERARLTELLRMDPGARDEYLRYLDLHAALADEALPLLESNIINYRPQDNNVAVGAGRLRVAFTRKQWVGAAAALVVLAAIVFLLWPNAHQSIVRITALNGPLQWTGDGGQIVGDLQAGSSLGGGTLESLSTESWVAFKFLDGSTVTLSGQSMLTISQRAQKELHLRAGDLSVDVAKQSEGKPMLLHTPTAKLEVLGTQFNVTAEPFVTLINVNEGRVRVTRLADGITREVPADHQAAASINRLADFKVERRQRPVDFWKSVLPEDANFGKWVPENGGLKAAPLLLKRHPNEPYTLYLTVLSVSPGDSPPVLLSSGSRFRIRGRLKTAEHISVGLTMRHPKGGFAGKYVAKRKIESPRTSGEFFDVEVPLKEFKSNATKFGHSPVGLELAELWCMTVTDAGLELTQVELRPHDRKQ